MVSGSDAQVLIGRYTEPHEKDSAGIHVYRLDGSTGELIHQAVIEDTPNVSFMVVHPVSGWVYAVNETEEFHGKPGGGVSAIARDAAGNFKVIGRGSSGGVHPCYISIERTGGVALVANYSGGSVAMLPIATDGTLSPASDVIQHSGSSVHPERQTAPHPHCILPDPANRFAVAIDLGLDKLIVYRMDLEHGKLHGAGEVKVETGSGPRHLLFSSNGQYAYLLNELNSTLHVYQYDSENGTFTLLQALSTLPEDFAGENYCSDLHLASDEGHLYISNRGHDSLVCLQVDERSGFLRYQSHISSGGHYPRIFAIDPSGRFLVAAHQNSDNVTVFRIDPETGNLVPTGHEVRVSRPVHVLFPGGEKVSNSPHTFS